VYIDEVGNHDLGHVEDANQRFLSLTGVILEGEYTRTVIQPEMEALKRTFFREDPDEPVILHRKEIVNRRRAFQVLRDLRSNGNSTPQYWPPSTGGTCGS
jgi:hypothetical protein